MKLYKNQILEPKSPDWSGLVALVNNHTPHGGWIFRALKKGPDNNELEVLSHFDEACRRARIRPSDRPLYEAWMLRDFRREAYHHLLQLPDRCDMLEWLALGRHYGMPVRLVDFTYSFYIAVYFAICRSTEKDDGWILAFDHDWHKKQLEARLVPGLAKRAGVRIEQAAFQNARLFREFAVEYARDYVAAVNPFRRNPRLAKQQGLFLCPANVRHDFQTNLEGTLPKRSRNERLVLIRVPAKARTAAMKELWQMNITGATLFPDLPGWAESRGDLVHQRIQDPRFKKELKLELRKPR